MPPQPRTRRHLVSQIRRRLDAEIAPIVVVRGPRQVGMIIADLLAEGVPATSILRVQFDELESLRRTKEPIIAISDWFERQVTSDRFNELAHGVKRHISSLTKCRT